MECDKYDISWDNSEGMDSTITDLLYGAWKTRYGMRHLWKYTFNNYSLSRGEATWTICHETVVKAWTRRSLTAWMRQVWCLVRRVWGHRFEDDSRPNGMPREKYIFRQLWKHGPDDHSLSRWNATGMIRHETTEIIDSTITYDLRYVVRRLWKHWINDHSRPICDTTSTGDHETAVNVQIRRSLTF